MELESAAEFERLLDSDRLAREAAEKMLTEGVVESADDRAMREAFASIGKTPAPASVGEIAELGRMAQVGRVLGKVARGIDALGPLGVMLPPIFWPDDRAAEALGGVQREALERRGRERRLQRERERVSQTRSRSGPPAPPSPPEVPRLPDLSPDELADVLGERQSKPSTTSTTKRTSARTGRSGSKTSDSSPAPWWQTVLEDAAQAGWETIYRRFAPRRSSSRRKLPPRARGRPPEPFNEPWSDDSRRPGSADSPAAKRDTERRVEPPEAPRPEASALPRALTAVTAELLGSRSDCPPCRTRRRPPRPSSKVPTVRSYTRRMSQNSLDNLKRGPGRRS